MHALLGSVYEYSVCVSITDYVFRTTEVSDCGRYVILYVNRGAEPKNLLYYCDLKNEPEERIAGEILAFHGEYPSSTTVNQFYCVLIPIPIITGIMRSKCQFWCHSGVEVYCYSMYNIQWKLSLRNEMSWAL